MKLSSRISIVMTMLVLAIGLVSGYVSVKNLQEEIHHEQYSWAKLLTSSLAESLATETINGNAITAEQILSRVKNGNDIIKDMYIVDFDGEIFAHTFDGDFPKQLIKHTKQTHDSHDRSIDNSNVTEISIPLINGMDANLHIYIDKEILDKHIETSIRKTIILYSIIGIIAIFISNFLSRRLSRPLEELDSTMRNYAESGSTDTIFLTTDIKEAAQLADAFNQVVAARKTTEETLYETEIHLKLLLDSTGEAMYGIDIDGKCTFANPACLKVLGYEMTEEILGKEMHKIIHRHNSEHTTNDCPISLAQDAGTLAHSENEVFWHKDGYSFPVEYWSHPIIDNGEIKGSVVTFNDISQRKFNDDNLKFSLKLSRAISTALAEFQKNPINTQPVFEQMLTDLLELTESEYGFIGEINLNPEGQRYLKTYAITDIAWNEQTRALYDQYGKTGFEFTNLNTLFGITIEKDQLVISNDPMNDKRRGGLPEGHPALNAYMGIPLMAGDRNVGMVGIANRNQGYDQFLLNKINPLLQTFANILVNSNNYREREHIDLVLRENEASLAAAQRVANVGSWVWDIQSGDLSWSDEIYRIFGLEPQQFPATYAAFLEYIHPDDVDIVTSAVGNAIGDERIDYDVTHRVVRPSGDIRFVHEKGVIFTDDHNTPIRMLGAVHDISDLFYAEEDLRKNEELLRNMFEQAEVGITRVSIEGTFVSVNRKLCEITGYTEKELLSITFQDITYHEDLDKDLGLLNQTLKGDRASYSIEKRYIRKDKSIVWINLSVSLVRDHQQAPLYFISVIEDITSRKNAEKLLEEDQGKLEQQVRLRTRELRDAQDELVRKERLATLGQLTATVSHELRNPLGAMRPSLYIIEKKTATMEDEKLNAAVDRINRNISRCDRIIDELLDFTRITGLDLSKANLDEWLGTVIHEQSIHDSIELDWQPELGDYVANLDFDRFRRAVINIIENGCHAMLDAGDLNKVIPNARLRIRSFMENDRINIQITDTGSGIPDDVLPNIFTPLYSTKGFGVGLGMPTVKQIMEQHRGGIDIETTVGQGTTTTLWIPADAHSEDIN